VRFGAFLVDGQSGSRMAVATFGGKGGFYDCSMIIWWAVIR
jgi:hypothetical protein